MNYAKKSHDVIKQHYFVGTVFAEFITLDMVNPRRACAASVTVVAVSVCVCVCLSVKSHLTSGASVCRENVATYSASNEGQKFCGVFSETALLPRSSAPSYDGHTSGRPFFLRITRMRTVHTQVIQCSRM